MQPPVETAPFSKKYSSTAQHSSTQHSPPQHSKQVTGQYRIMCIIQPIIAFLRLLQLLVEVAQHSTAQHSMGMGQLPGIEEVLSCVKNIRQVAMLLQQPGRRFKGPRGADLAATCIQAHWRSAIPHECGTACLQDSTLKRVASQGLGEG